MRRAISFLLIGVFLTSTGSTVFAQRNRDRQRQGSPAAKPEKGPVKKPTQTSEDAKFGTVQAFSEGNGVWVHWQMDLEISNQGFNVYRIDQDGERSISDLIPGSATRYSDVPTYGENYAYFDKDGTAGSVYYVQTGGNKTVVRSDRVGVSSVSALPKIDGDTLFQQAAVSEEQVRPTVMQPTLPDDLSWEVASNALTADPNKHREVISQPGVRISAKASGLIRVTRAQLEAGGFNVNSDPTTWQLYLQGVELPIIIGPNADYIEFLGKSLDTVESDIRVYYLIAGSGPGKRLRSTLARRTIGTIVAQSYRQTTVKKERTIYTNAILNGPAENYWGRAITTGTLPLQFTLTGIDQTPGDRILTVRFQGSTLTPHSISLTLNGNVLAPVVGDGHNVMTKSYTIPVSYLAEGTNTLQMNSGAGDTSYFDSFSIDFPRIYLAENDRLDFYTSTNKITRLSGFSTPNVRLFDLTDEATPVEIVGTKMIESNGKFGPEIPPSRSRVMYATEAANVAGPVSVTSYNPELLSDASLSAQLVIISYAGLMDSAVAWANYRAGQGVNTKLVDVAEIFDEFSYGVSTSAAIEAFLQYAKNNWQTAPGYVLLIGDSTNNPRNYGGNSVPNTVPTRFVDTFFEETGSDEALVDFNDDGLADIAIGRITAQTNDQVAVQLNKVTLWEASLTPTSLQTRGALFAYDQFDQWNFEAMSNRLMAKLPTGVPITTVQRGIPDSTTAKAVVVNSYNSGVFVANYSGHGTAGAWRDSSFFSNTTVATLTNANTPVLVTSLTCLNAYFVLPTVNSIAENLTRSANGGAVAIWASTGKTTPDVQEIMAGRFYEQLGAGNIPRVGDLIRDAKAQLISGADVRLSWTLIGDPMLKVR